MKKDSQIVYLSTHDWRNPPWKQNKISANPLGNKFNAITPRPFNAFPATNKTHPTSHYITIHAAFNTLLSKTGSKIYSSILSPACSKIYSSIACLFTTLLHSKNQHDSLIEEQKKEVVEKQRDRTDNADDITIINDQVEEIVDGNRPLNFLKGMGNILLFSSVSQEYFVPSKILLFLGANPNIKIRGETPLFRAINNNDTDIAELLFKYGADINSKNSWGYTPLHHAILLKTKTLMALWLIQKGADINIRTPKNNNALHLTAKTGNTEVMKALIQQPEIDINAKAKKDYTALHLAVYNNYTRYPTNASCVKSYLNKIPAVALLLQSGANPNALDHEGTSVLCRAINSPADSTKSIRLLLKHGAEPDVKNYKGTPLILFAAQKGEWKVVKLLAQAKANVDVYDEKGNSIISLAVQAHATEALKLLLASHDPTKYTDRHLKLLIMTSIVFSNLEIVQLVTLLTNVSNTILSEILTSNKEVVLELRRKFFSAQPNIEVIFEWLNAHVQQQPQIKSSAKISVGIADRTQTSSARVVKENNEEENNEEENNEEENNEEESQEELTRSSSDSSSDYASLDMFDEFWESSSED